MGAMYNCKDYRVKMIGKQIVLYHTTTQFCYTTKLHMNQDSRVKKVEKQQRSSITLSSLAMKQSYTRLVLSETNRCVGRKNKASMF